MPDLKLAIVTDIHHGRDSRSKRGSAALPLLNNFLTAAVEADAQAIIDLGDRITDVDRETDLRLAEEVAQSFRKFRRHRFHIDGNHDRVFLSGDDNEALLESQTRTRATELGGIRPIFWQPDVTLDFEAGMRLAPNDLEDLRSILGGSEQRTLLFSHVPLSGQSMSGNHLFENNPTLATYAEIPDVRRTEADRATD